MRRLTNTAPPPDSVRAADRDEVGVDVVDLHVALMRSARRRHPSGYGGDLRCGASIMSSRSTSTLSASAAWRGS